MVTAIIVLSLVFLAHLLCSLVSKRRSLRAVERLEKCIASAIESPQNQVIDSADHPLFDTLSDQIERLRRTLVESEMKQNARERKAYSSFSYLKEGVLFVTPALKVISINSAAAKILEVEPAEFRGDALDAIGRGRQLVSMVLRVLESGYGFTIETSWEADETKHLQVQAIPLYHSNTEISEVMMILNDVTQIRQLESIRKDFVANVSHELRTPITSILGFVETLLDGACEDPSVSRHFLEIVFFQAERLQLIVNDLLLIAQIEEAGQGYELERTPVLVDEIFSCVANLMQSKASAKHIILGVRTVPSLTVKAHRLLLEQALLNLVSNAIKYSNSGASVTLISEVQDDRVVLSVEDTGIGIAKEHLPRLFERFYRVDSGRSREEGGSGLGLAIVKHIISAHDGSIEVTSDIGRGSVFSISLASCPVTPLSNENEDEDLDERRISFGA